jgi:hypothetical protein
LVNYREIREIHENGFAFVRVFRVVRGEKASFLSLFAANQWKCLSRNYLQITPSFTPRFGGQTRSNPVKPSQTIFFNLTVGDHSNQAVRQLPASHSDGRRKVVCDSRCMCWAFLGRRARNSALACAAPLW